MQADQEDSIRLGNCCCYDQRLCGKYGENSTRRYRPICATATCDVVTAWLVLHHQT